VVLGYNRTTNRPIRRTKGGFRTKTEALEYAQTLKGSKQSKRFSLDHYWKIWNGKALEKLSDTRETAYNIAYRKLASVVHLPLSEITLSDLQKVMDEKAHTHHPAKDMRIVLTQLYKLAIVDGQASANLAQYVQIPEAEESEPMPFTETELRAFWADYAAGHKYTGYILLMIYSGMMPGELLKCRKDMIDFDRQQIVGSGLKTKKRKATPIVIADFMLPVLNDLCQLHDSEKLVRMNKDNFYKEFHATTARCGCRDLPPYACRHTTATALAIDSNIAPSIIQEVMRHSKFATTQQYIHPDTKDALSAINTLKHNFVGSDVGSNE